MATSNQSYKTLFCCAIKTGCDKLACFDSGKLFSLLHVGNGGIRIGIICLVLNPDETVRIVTDFRLVNYSVNTRYIHSKIGLARSWQV
jgi:hypothetical protein